MNENVLSKKTLAFAIKSVRLMQVIQSEKKEYIISKQFMRSGTSIGAHVREANFAQSQADFVHKLQGAVKEANETEYWLIIMRETDYISPEQFNLITPDLIEIIKILTSSINTIKSKIIKK